MYIQSTQLQIQLQSMQTDSERYGHRCKFICITIEIEKKRKKVTDTFVIINLFMHESQYLPHLSICI